MSYNINSTEILSGSLSMKASKVLAWRARRRDLPELCPLDDLPGNGALLQDLNADIPLQKFWWSGEFSGHAYDLLAEFVADVQGEADILFTWEGGDSFSGIRIKDGKFTEHKVVMALGDPVG